MAYDVGAGGCAGVGERLTLRPLLFPRHPFTTDRPTMTDFRAELDKTRGAEASVEQVAQIVYENAMLATAPDHAKPHWPSWADLPNSDARIHALNTAEIILTRWGRPAAPAPKPIPVSERLPEDADCLVIPPLGTSTFPLRYCWQASEIMHCGQALLIWDWKLVPHTTDKHWPFTYWLPASTRFLPTTVDPAKTNSVADPNEAEA